MSGLVSSLPRFLQPAYIDEGRYIVQAPVFSKLLEKNPPSGACLNAGCGEMLYFDWLNSFPGLTRITHMDLHTERASPLRGNPRHESLPGSLTALPFPGQSFGFIFCTEVLEHIPDDHQAATEISRVLQPGGLALISTPTPPAPFDPNHVREGYTLTEMKALLGAHGLTVLDHRYTFRFPFRSLYLTWMFLLRHVGQGRISAMPRVVLRCWSHLEHLVPIGRPWDLAVLARKA